MDEPDVMYELRGELPAVYWVVQVRRVPADAISLERGPLLEWWLVSPGPPQRLSGVDEWDRIDDDVLWAARLRPVVAETLGLPA